jgi:hypothetical protein
LIHPFERGESMVDGISSMLSCGPMHSIFSFPCLLALMAHLRALTHTMCPACVNAGFALTHSMSHTMLYQVLVTGPGPMNAQTTKEDKMPICSGPAVKTSAFVQVLTGSIPQRSGTAASVAGDLEGLEEYSFDVTRIVFCFCTGDSDSGSDSDSRTRRACQ